ncbi:ricin-type beta-trefoil lectin domain protein [Candidatus Nomurabacteria bacterium]|nr:ricin-type beta-trefoil lectin domain protein [Candidatus Nomurabacteria bacterium]
MFRRKPFKLLLSLAIAITFMHFSAIKAEASSVVYNFPVDTSNHKIESGFGYGDQVKTWYYCNTQTWTKEEVYRSEEDKKKIYYHTGIDIVHQDDFEVCDINSQDNEVDSIAEGEIVVATNYYDSPSGSLVAIKLNEQYHGQDLYAVYMHIHKRDYIQVGEDTSNLTDPGQRNSNGQLILGEIGHIQDMPNANNAHLHFDLRRTIPNTDHWGGYDVDKGDPNLTASDYIDPCTFFIEKGLQENEIPQNCFDIIGTVRNDLGDPVTNGSVNYGPVGAPIGQRYKSEIYSSGRYYINGDLTAGFTGDLRATDYMQYWLGQVTLPTQKPYSRDITLLNICIEPHPVGVNSLLGIRSVLGASTFILDDPCQPPPQPQNDYALFVDDVNVPDGTDFLPGQAFTKIWRLRNTGDTTWSSDYKLAFDHGAQLGGPQSVSLPYDVAPGQEVDVSVNLVAPQNVYNGYKGYWIMENQYGQKFDQIMWVEIDVVSGQDNAKFIADVSIPDGTTMPPGNQFTKTWRVKNTGISTWDSGYKLKYQYGDQLSAPSEVSLPNNVSPGQEVEISVNMTAPGSTGHYRGFWKMTNSSDQSFGDILWVDINVIDGDNAEFVADITIPDGTEMAPGQAFTKIWRIKNNGTSTWNSGYKLHFDHGSQMGGPNEVSLSNDVPPGQEVNISVDLVAPLGVGNYRGYWKMHNSADVPFGEIIWVDIVTTSTNDNAEFVADITVPDGTDFSPNTPFTKIWRIRNIGTTTWNSSYKLAFQSGDHMSGPNEASLPHDVNPGEEVDISVDLVAPSGVGHYRGYWKMENADGYIFGEVLWVDIDVVDNVDDAIFIADVTVPDGTDFEPNTAFTKIWRIENTGTSTWDSNYKLQFQYGDQMSGPNEVSLPNNVSPGQQVDIAVDLVSPGSDGNYVGYWKMRNGSGQVFGEIIWVNIDVVAQNDDAMFVADITVPDGTEFAPNETFTKIWRMRNTGTTTWDSNYTLAFDSGSQMGGPNHVQLPNNVSPGQEVDIAVNLIAPGSAGEYIGYWKMKNGSGQRFGDLIWVDIVVVENQPSGIMINKIGAPYSLNAAFLYDYGNVNLWDTNSNDPDQKWELISGNRIRRLNTNYCLNTPNRYNGGNVFLWTCNENDQDQKWEFISGDRIRLLNTNYCLNAYQPGQGSNIDIWSCDINDNDQKFSVQNVANVTDKLEPIDLIELQELKSPYEKIIKKGRSAKSKAVRTTTSPSL